MRRVVPDLVTKAKGFARGAGRSAAGPWATTMTATTIATQPSAAAARSLNRTDPLGSHHVIWRPRNPVAARHGGDFHDRAGNGGDHGHTQVHPFPQSGGRRLPAAYH